MNASQSQPPGDKEIDALLARRYRDTSPEFEARWVALKREMRTAPRPARHAWFTGWNRWFALAGAAAAVVLTVSVWRKAPPPQGPTQVSPALAELFAMEAVLGRGAVLLDAENRDALLHLPVSQPRS
jgi:heme A synthase